VIYAISNYICRYDWRGFCSKIQIVAVFERDPANPKSNHRKRQVALLVACPAFKDRSSLERPDAGGDCGEGR
jgi:hypothetical protein